MSGRKLYHSSVFGKILVERKYELSKMQRSFASECKILRLVRFDFTIRAAAATAADAAAAATAAISTTAAAAELSESASAGRGGRVSL
jgi:hypothetical protein